MRIGITYNLKSDLHPFPHSAFPENLSEEFDRPETIDAIREALSTDGHAVYLLGADLGITEKIRRDQIEFVLNLAEGFRGRSREAQIPALLELMKVPYSGSDPLGLAITLDKSLAKRIAISLGIPTPDFWVLDHLADLHNVPNRFPLFVKPLWQGSSIGIRNSSRVENPTGLEQEASRLFECCQGEPVLVEAYVSGREFTVGILGNQNPEVIGVMEMTFRHAPQQDFCYSLEVKQNWKEQVDYHVPPNLEEPLERQIRASALELFKALRLRDLARFDFRMSRDGRIYFLEVNPLPGLSPESGDFVILAGKKGLSHRELILKILQAALDRYPDISRSKVRNQKNG